MEKISFHDFDPMQSEAILPQMFDILSANMNEIAPTGGSREEDMKIWLSYRQTERAKEARIILMYVGEALAGYFQYSVSKDTVLVEEIEIAPEYQRTFLFYRFLKIAGGIIPEGAKYIEAYIDKRNLNSQRIAQRLGMRVVGENKSGHSFRLRGELGTLEKILR